MNNHETAEKLISEARYLQDELSRAHKQQHWNLAVRRAQEVVELSLKALGMTIRRPVLFDDWFQGWQPLIHLSSQ